MSAALVSLRLTPGMRVLEVGCGSGGYSRLMAAGLQGNGEWIAVATPDEFDSFLSVAAGCFSLVSSALVSG